MKNVKFGDILRELRCENSLTLKKLSEKTLINKSTLSRLERNERMPKANEIVNLVKFFNVSADYLCGLED